MKNLHPGDGQLSSLQLALRHVERDGEAVLVWPVDQPAVSEEAVRGLIRLFREGDAPLVLPRHGDRRGHPAIIHRSLFAALLALPPAEGAKEWVRRQKTAELETNDRWTVDDIDTPADFLELTGERLAAALARVRLQPAG